MDAHYLKKEELDGVKELLKELGIDKSEELLKFCIYAGGCIGVYDDNKMVACILDFVYHDLYTKHFELSDEIFGDARVPNGRILTSDDPVLGILGVYVKPDYRGKNFGGLLFDNIIVNQAHYRLVGLMGNTEYKKILTERGFQFTELTNGQLFFELEARRNGAEI